MRNTWIFILLVCSVVIFGGIACAPEFDRYGLGGVRFVIDRPIEAPPDRTIARQTDCSGRGFVMSAPKGDDTPIAVYHEMSFDGKDYQISLHVSNYLYRATLGSLEMCRLENEDAYAAYYQNITTQPAMISFYEKILTPLREIRDKELFDDSKYARFIVRFVQSFGYCEQLTGMPKAPVATVVEGCGDCDEKSVLLAGLLSTEGYDVALFMFWNHMAVGLRTEEDGYRGTDYLYVESTHVMRLGMPKGIVNMELFYDPFVIGTGSKTVVRSKTEVKLDMLMAQAMVSLQEYRDDIDEESAARFKDIALDLKTVAAAKTSINRHAAKMLFHEKMYLTYAGIVMYIIYSPYGDDEILSWVNQMLAWAATLEREGEQ